MSIYRFLFIFLNSFHWINTKLDLKDRWSYFRSCVKDRPQRTKCVGHFGPPNKSKLRFSTILLKRLIWIHTSLALYSHWIYFQRFVQYGASKAQFLGHFGRKSKSKFCTLFTFSKSFHWFHISIASHVHWKYFQRCMDPDSWVILGPNIGLDSAV